MDKPKIISIKRQNYTIKLRWYKGFYCQGNQEEIIKKIHDIVDQFLLDNYLLNMYVSQPSNNVFYIFFGIKSEKLNHIPLELKTNLIILLQQSRKYIFTEIVGNGTFSYYDEIISWKKLELEPYEFTNRVPYKRKLKNTDNNPFDIAPLLSKNYFPISESLQTYVQKHEHLLYWLSTIGSGTWETFRKSCETLQLEEPKRILRRLRLLGHLETSANGRKWSTAPSTIVKIASEKPEFILCGQRNLKLINQLKSLGIVAEINNQPREEAPPCLRLLVDDPNVITQQLPIVNAGEASRKLADILPEFTTWQQNLTALEIVPSLKQWKKFQDDSFEVCGTPHETGMYQMCDENFNPRYTLFYNQETKTWHQGDWYGLRFLALQSQGIACQSYYNIATKHLAIPINQRWPEIYERALVLASGKLPTYQKSWLIYENICEEVAYVLSEKLNVNFNSDYQEELSCA